MSAIYNVGPYWQGYERIKKLVVFGDSFSHVGYNLQAPAPTSIRPLGVAFPGQVVNEPGHPNWVGHLIRTHSHGHANFVVWDYAVRGDTAPGVVRQIREQFLPAVGRRPSWANWKPDHTLFITWIGTNDCRLLYTNDRREIAAIIANLFAGVEELYAAGARNFMFVDVPPMHRSPVAPPGAGNEYAQPFINWNDELRLAVGRYAAHRPDATLLIFSSWATYTRVLDQPERHGFARAATQVRGGEIWFDHMHPTTRMADIIAGDAAQFLLSVPPA
ncbi:uncharacterized protein STEHIDRAFT_155938 [Stereum hirsutum FP-91666 SS1]|uniref:uncharacterized protein n=1 Tax=Stereum hirsutum (strain FP-91666) TaxID=721885 RepID=UPI000440CE1B|nr:uncharacterized protein STEHIDRAFT_155938 [Stereum hirsutum FP-91666 SS1]EIM88584.1 hypothetical protein STEHIDRAFT_155938 [Stereum hirsutum FP-91666 SS1]